MKTGRIWSTGLMLTGLLMVAGCSQLNDLGLGRVARYWQSGNSGNSGTSSALPAIPPSSSGVSAMLKYGGEIASLSARRQQTACAQARSHLNVKPDDQARMTLAMVGVLVPECLSSKGLSGVLQPVINDAGSPFYGLARVMLALDQQRRHRDRELADSRNEVASLKKKLKDLTRIETQLNQVKNRELQNLN